MHDPFRSLACVSVITSVLCTLFAIYFSISLHKNASLARRDIEERAEVLKIVHESFWDQIQWEIRTMPWIGVALREKRDYGQNPDGKQRNEHGVLHQCSQCQRLACPMGMAGREGGPGTDGMPGLPGKTGNPGIDGEDIELDSPPDLPCSICPGGPPGPRGAQGERGMSGTGGTRGYSGLPGNPGQDGGPGLSGNSGPSGHSGLRGPKGPIGRDVIAGEGIKGPRGPPGPRGIAGSRGVPGRASNQPGIPGQPGTQGKIGKAGLYGQFGDRGSPGAPGDPGLSGTYCPSDCGVNKIVSELVHLNPASNPNGYDHPEDVESRPQEKPFEQKEGNIGYDLETIQQKMKPPGAMPNAAQPAYKSAEEYEEQGYRMLFSAV
ncbi:unnamed protein product, partial [Mesorhabditis belari]|uniref:Collagen n=1 Tax=Mesorhabditis belari TaxID=2138241 RepID=A0AAF3ELW6_9BILA